MISAFLGSAALKNIPWRLVGIGAVVVLTGWYIYHLKLTVADLRTEIAEQELTIAEKIADIEGLKGSIASQNNAIEQWRLIARSKQEAVADALQEAEQQSRRADQMIERLQASQATTCEEGIELIDEALGL